MKRRIRLIIDCFAQLFLLFASCNLYYTKEEWSWFGLGGIITASIFLFNVSKEYREEIKDHDGEKNEFF